MSDFVFFQRGKGAPRKAPSDLSYFDVSTNRQECRVCKRWLDLADFHLNKTTVLKRDRRCKSCMTKAMRIVYSNLHPNPRRRGRPELSDSELPYYNIHTNEQQCSKCKVWKDLSNFTPDLTGPVLMVDRRCKACEAKRHRKHRAFHHQQA